MLTRVESNINEFYFFDRGSFYLESVIENLRSIGGDASRYTSIPKNPFIDYDITPEVARRLTPLPG